MTISRKQFVAEQASKALESLMSTYKKTPKGDKTALVKNIELYLSIGAEPSISHIEDFFKLSLNLDALLKPILSIFTTDKLGEILVICLKYLPKQDDPRYPLHLELFNECLQRRANTNIAIRLDYGKTALFYALEKFEPALIEALLKSGAKIDLRTNDKPSPYDAISTLETKRLYLDTVLKLVSERSLELTKYEAITLQSNLTDFLCLAIKRKDNTLTEDIQHCLSQGADFSMSLFTAIEVNAPIEILEALLKHKMVKSFYLPSNVFNKDHQATLGYLLQAGAMVREEDILTSIKAGLDVTSLYITHLPKFQHKHLHPMMIAAVKTMERAASFGTNRMNKIMLSFIEACLSRGISIDTLLKTHDIFNELATGYVGTYSRYYTNQATLLHLATYLKQPSLIRSLILWGADMTLRDEKKLIPFDYISSNPACEEAYFLAIAELKQRQTNCVRAYYLINGLLQLNPNLPPHALITILDEAFGPLIGAPKVLNDYHRITRGRFTLFQTAPTPSTVLAPSPEPTPTLSGM